MKSFPSLAILGSILFLPGCGEEGAPARQPAAGPSPALLDPALAGEKAPEKFRAIVSTTKGDVTVEVTREWSPHGADRFYNLVKIGFFTDVAFFRVLPGFMAQFGISGDPRVSAKWRSADIPDDEVKQSNRRGYVTFAKTGAPASRTTQLFINLADNPNLDRTGFSPIGRVVNGMDVVDSLFKGYGEAAPTGMGPDQGQIQLQGNTYLRQAYTALDYVKSASLFE